MKRLRSLAVLMLCSAVLCVRPGVTRGASSAFVSDDAGSAAPRMPGSDQPPPAGVEHVSNHVTLPVDAQSYRLGPGDLLQLNYSGRLSRSQSLPIGPEGTAFIPGWGVLRLGGLTLAEARQLVDQRLGTELRGVQLDLELVRVRMLRVYLTGEVQSPGPVDLIATSRVSDALSESSATAGASRRNLEVRHADGTREIADLGRFELTGDPVDDPFLMDGDVISVPKATRYFEVRGAVARSGRFELGPRDSLHTMLEMAGGLLPTSRPERALFIRWLTPSRDESVFVDVGDIDARRTNFPIEDGARLYVYSVAGYHELEQVSIQGEINAAGSYPIVPGRTRLSDLIRNAGGFTARADSSTMHVYRANPESSEPDPELDRLSRLSRGEMTSTEYEILRTRLTAKRADFRVDWSQVRPGSELDIVLMSGDIVDVDRVRATVRVEGEVVRPGLIEYSPELRPLDYVKLAGGFSERAAGGRVLVTRRLTGQTLRARDVDRVAPGDMIWVPDKPDLTLLQQLLPFVAVAAQIATIILVVRH